MTKTKTPAKPSTMILSCRIISFQSEKKTRFQQSVLKNFKKEGRDVNPMIISIGSQIHHVVGNFYTDVYLGDKKLYCQFFFDSAAPPSHSEEVMQQVINKLSLEAAGMRLRQATLVIHNY